MIKTVVQHPDSPLLLLGLTEDNLIRLKNGQAIQVDMKAMGMDKPGRVGIIWGQTMADIEGALRQAGVIGDRTKITSDPRIDAEMAITSEHDKILIVTVGLPRSGKTTWAQSQAWPIVCPDAIRLAIHGQRFIGQAEPFVWATARAMVSALFLAGHKIVILDATNITEKRRSEWVQPDLWSTFFKVFDTPAQTCIERARAIGDEAIVPVIERMNEAWQGLAPGTPLWPGSEEVQDAEGI